MKLLLFERVGGNFLLGWTGFVMIERVLAVCVFFPAAYIRGRTCGLGIIPLN